MILRALIAATAGATIVMCLWCLSMGRYDLAVINASLAAINVFLAAQ